MSTIPENSSAPLPLQLFARQYILEMVIRRGYKIEPAGLLQTEVSKQTKHMIEKIALQFGDERYEEVENMCFELQITSETLKELFCTLAQELFYGTITWRRVAVFIALAGAMALYCAENGIEQGIQLIIQWTENYICKHLDKWIATNGGWKGFFDFFNEPDRNTNSFFALGTGIAALAITSGLLLLKLQV